MRSPGWSRISAPGPGLDADLLVGAARSWLAPVLPLEPAERRRRRVQAGVATTWAAWCAGFLVAPTANKALRDPPGPCVTDAS